MKSCRFVRHPQKLCLRRLVRIGRVHVCSRERFDVASVSFSMDPQDQSTEKKGVFLTPTTSRASPRTGPAAASHERGKTYLVSTQLSARGGCMKRLALVVTVMGWVGLAWAQQP